MGPETLVSGNAIFCKMNSHVCKSGFQMKRAVRDCTDLAFGVSGIRM